MLYCLSNEQQMTPMNINYVKIILTLYTTQLKMNIKYPQPKNQVIYQRVALFNGKVMRGRQRIVFILELSEETAVPPKALTPNTWHLNKKSVRSPSFQPHSDWSHPQEVPSGTRNHRMLAQGETMEFLSCPGPYLDKWGDGGAEWSSDCRNLQLVGPLLWNCPTVALINSIFKYLWKPSVYFSRTASPTSDMAEVQADLMSKKAWRKPPGAASGHYFNPFFKDMQHIPQPGGWEQLLQSNSATGRDGASCSQQIFLK